MPPLTGQGGLPSAKIVLGDRFGRSASGRLTDAAAHIFAARGLKVAQNHPYPGNYLLERHGRPSFNVHAIQCEIDRSLYLDGRSEEHTSELQSLMRISYAVFCLKKQNTSKHDFRSTQLQHYTNTIIS